MTKYEKIELQYNVDNARDKLFADFDNIIKSKYSPVPLKTSLDLQVKQQNTLLNHQE